MRVPAMPAVGLRALLWDVDGTLAETERDGHRIAFNRAFEEADLPWRWDIERYGSLLDVTGGRERLLADMLVRPDAPADPLERERLARELHQSKSRHYEALVEAGGIGLRPGVRELVLEAHTCGLRQAIATTTGLRNVVALLTAAFGPGWERYFKVLVCSEHVRVKKPDPEVYFRAAEALGIVPGEALAMEDSPAGAAAARAAGVPVVVTRSIYFAGADFDCALAVGPGLEVRTGWRPVLRGGGRVTLRDLRRWHAQPHEARSIARADA